MPGVLAETIASAGHGVAVDAHVHFHDVRRVEATLEAAKANFEHLQPGRSGFSGILLLAQSAGERVFEALDGWQGGRWSVARLPGESGTAMARTGNTTIAIVCGRQVRTEEGLEVLALGTTETFADGLPLTTACDLVAQSGALPVVPWGFGKLVGERGRRVSRLLVDRVGHTLFIGDNGSRLHMLGVPALVRNGAARGYRVLPGTDPFPIARDYRRVGSLGFLADLAIDESQPWSQLRSWLLELQCSPLAYGRACGITHFVRIQAGIQFYNRIRRRHSA